MAQGEVGFRLAAETVDITPPVGYFLGGYGGRDDPSNDIHDPLYARVLVLDDGQTRVAIVTLDLLSLSWPRVQAIREAIAAAADLPAGHVMVNWSHTHAGPDMRRYEGYQELLTEQLAGAAGLASRNLRPGTVTYAEDSIEFNVNRRHRTEDGRIIMAPNPEGIVDRRVRVLRFDSDAAPAVVLFHAVCHSNALRSENLAISADFPGYAQELVALAFAPSCTPMFVQGCAGNIRANLGEGADFRNGDEEDLRWCGYSLGGAAVRAASRAGTREGRGSGSLGTRLAVAETVLEFDGLDGKLLHYPIQALRIGDLLIVTLPGDPVVEYGLEIERQAQGWSQVIVAGYSNNGHAGYLSTAEHYTQGGYEATMPASRLTAEAQPGVIETALALADKLRRS